MFRGKVKVHSAGIEERTKLPSNTLILCKTGLILEFVELLQPISNEKDYWSNIEAYHYIGRINFSHLKNAKFSF